MYSTVHNFPPECFVIAPFIVWLPNGQSFIIAEISASVITGCSLALVSAVPVLSTRSPFQCWRFRPRRSGKTRRAERARAATVTTPPQQQVAAP